MEQRKRLLQRIATAIANKVNSATLRVAIDGVDGAGKSTFADELWVMLCGEGVRIIRASLDGFHNPKIIRYRKGRYSPEGFYHDSYDYEALKRLLLDPLAPAGSGVYTTAVFNHVMDRPVVVSPREANRGMCFSLMVFSCSGRSCAGIGTYPSIWISAVILPYPVYSSGIAAPVPRITP